jgi:hypothetical protein
VHEKLSGHRLLKKDLASLSLRDFLKEGTRVEIITE